ncbi:hypothetical protein [Desulfogranum japonicum]|uniref:hypothetical protein n=1 Tax=Desulfogranum japonicum TaxID=231447 RepID=UPI0004291CD3|nr:hypothetical protein [Desulfogranum japonicum]
MNVDPAFEKHLSHVNLDALSKSQDVIYIVDSSIRLMAFNEAWIIFARKNDGENILSNYLLGTQVSEVGIKPIRKYILNGYMKALREKIPFVHDYECSSPQAYRVFHQTAYPIFDSSGLIITHHLIINKQHTEREIDFYSHFENDQKIVTQCANCRKIRDPQNDKTWFWVPELVERPLPNTSHGICDPCLDHYYPDI